MEQMQTHHSGCWENPRHHACAIRVVKDLKAKLDNVCIALQNSLAEGHKLETKLEKAEAQRDEFEEHVFWYRIEHDGCGEGAEVCDCDHCEAAKEVINVNACIERLEKKAREAIRREAMENV